MFWVVISVTFIVSVVLLSLTFVLVPIFELVDVYLHIFSLLLFAMAQYLSARYVQLEQNGDPDLKLDDFTKLERHGFHILAQLVLCVALSCLLGLKSDLARVSLAIFLIPVVARMCAMPVNRLIIAHNVACSIAMLLICIYVLNRVPTLLACIQHLFWHLKNILIFRGIRGGKFLFPFLLNKNLLHAKMLCSCIS
ncbi:unnamed protein product [Gongylonema pulchrum]|uniref:TRC8_N domain-containing protein n=1 Tax=Gongylonema pulchrum TaxID=637853 RepID=A0A183DLD7_9BILA|nr:unnamed protein product [Gongylonema pulchrum]